MRPASIVALFLVGTVLLYGGWRYLHPYSEPRPADNSQANIKKQSDPLKMEVVIVPYFTYRASEDKLLDREKEYMTCLQRNLNHNLVSRIHILTTNAEETRQIFKKYELPNPTKLLISEVKSVEMVKDIFDYISQNLVGKNIMFTNGDIWLGNGFDLVDPIVMRKQKIMYAITRRIVEEERCGRTDLCLELPYIACHDSFLFYLDEAIPEQALEFLNFKFPAPGTENVLMWVFQKKLKYCVLNPCPILETFHFHCSRLQNHGSWKRINYRNNSVTSPVTKKLVC